MNDKWIKSLIIYPLCVFPIMSTCITLMASGIITSKKQKRATHRVALFYYLSNSAATSSRYFRMGRCCGHIASH